MIVAKKGNRTKHFSLNAWNNLPYDSSGRPNDGWVKLKDLAKPERLEPTLVEKILNDDPIKKLEIIEVVNAKKLDVDITLNKPELLEAVKALL